MDVNHEIISEYTFKMRVFQIEKLFDSEFLEYSKGYIFFNFSDLNKKWLLYFIIKSVKLKIVTQLLFQAAINIYCQKMRKEMLVLFAVTLRERIW